METSESMKAFPDSTHEFSRAREESHRNTNLLEMYKSGSVATL